MIVIDLGCFPHGKHFPHEEDQVSIEPLIEWFRPAVLYGFDPHPDQEEGTRFYKGSAIITERKAAWTEDGKQMMAVRGDGTSLVVEHEGSELEECETFDLNSFLHWLPSTCPIVLKMDVEGAEYTLIERLIEGVLDYRLQLLVVEWHDGDYAPSTAAGWREKIEREIMCPIVDGHSILHRKP